MKACEDQKFIREDFIGESFASKSFIVCVFENCIFQKSDFRSAHFSECTFKSCNLHLVKMEGCRFQGVLLDERKIAGGEFFKSDNRFFSLEFRKCILMGCNFSDMKMK